MNHKVLNLKRPHKIIDDDWIEQDGELFNWSESNFRYERAWWLDKDIRIHPLVSVLRQQRPDPREQ